MHGRSLGCTWFLTALVETTALTLNAAFAFMGLYPDFQEEMYQEIISAMPSEDDCVSACIFY